MRSARETGTGDRKLLCPYLVPPTLVHPFLDSEEVYVTRGQMAGDDLLVTCRLMKLMNYRAE